MRSKLLWLVVETALLLGCVLYFYRASRNRSDIDPHAAEEIEKAKRR
jgi:hypothetical protein